MKKQFSILSLLTSFLIIIGLSSCIVVKKEVVVKHDNGKHNGWNKVPIQSNEKNHPSNHGNGNSKVNSDEHSKGNSNEHSKGKSDDHSKGNSKGNSNGKSKGKSK